MSNDTKSTVMTIDTSLAEEALKNPEILASLQDEAGLKLRALKNFEKLAGNIKRRVRALKNYQLNEIKIEENFFRELSKLEAKYMELYNVIHDKRKDVISGTKEPSDSDCDYQSDIDELADEVGTKATIKSGDEVNNTTNDSTAVTDGENRVDGIPDFWVTVLQNCELIRENIQEHDLPVLKHLTDIRCILKADEEDHGFVLEFYFSSNEFFTDEKLVKEYFVQISAPKRFPFNYEGPEIIRTKGCNIHWNPGKNKTVKLVKKIQKRVKRDADKRTITKVVKNDSFFNFFDPPTDSLDSDDEVSSDVENILEADFEIGQFIRERIIPRAVLYFTGEGIEEEFDLDEEEEEDGSDEEESEDYLRVGK